MYYYNIYLQPLYAICACDEDDQTKQTIYKLVSACTDNHHGDVLHVEAIQKQIAYRSSSSFCESN